MRIRSGARSVSDAFPASFPRPADRQAAARLEGQEGDQCANAFGPFTDYVYAGGVTVAYQGDTKVTSVAITGQTDRTASGVGVGSTEKAVKKRVHGLKCETIAGAHSCHVGAFGAFLPAGKRVTDSTIRNDRVKRVTVGLIALRLADLSSTGAAPRTSRSPRHPCSVVACIAGGDR